MLEDGVSGPQSTGHAARDVLSLRHASRRKTLIALLVVLVVSACAVTVAPAAEAYESSWEGYVCSGCYVKDTEEWPNGGYHKWDSAGTAHVGGTAVERICIWLYNGSSWESGSGCNRDSAEVIGLFPEENALAQSQGWSYSGGALTLFGHAYGP